MKKIIEGYFYVSEKQVQFTVTTEPGEPATWRGILKAMKISAAIILITALHVSASSVAQKISFTGENVPLTKVFNASEEQLGFGVLMPHKLMESSKPVNVHVKDGTLDELLKQCFEFQPWKLSYAITGHTIYISQANPPADEPKGKGIAPGKNVKVTGFVYTESGEPLSGANVTIKESQKGAITDVRGQFDLGVIPTGSIIIISFIGYSPQSVAISDTSNLKIYLKVARNELDKVVVQAYGLTSQRLTTGDIATVSAEQIERQPEMNPLAALQGQVPGLVVTQTNGYASAPFKVEIRGRSVLNPNIASEPLYIIDGVPLTVVDYGNNGSYGTGSVGITQNGFFGPAGGQSPFFSINPGDIESITVLKD
ncbi:MAG TPA: carboxypeptidase-like regulatory domain-containing protein, partial [Mucilaginibacter sp.]|nr:carboxypeptidase-like regulatory domain-containing protein [Mucilaginibacter sp.]